MQKIGRQHRKHTPRHTQKLMTYLYNQAHLSRCRTRRGPKVGLVRAFREHYRIAQ